MGGRLLMLAAARHPDAFRKLVIESASLGLADEKERAQRRELDRQRARKLKSAGLTAFCEDWYAMEMWGGLDRLPPRQGNEAGLAGALNLFSVGNQPDLRNWLRFSSCRVLWLAGSRDAVYVENAKWVRQHCHHPVKILAAGHNVHLQHPMPGARPCEIFWRGAPVIRSSKGDIDMYPEIIHHEEDYENAPSVSP